MRLDLRGSPATLAQAALDAGCNVTFEMFPELSTVYSLDDVTLAEIGKVASDSTNPLGLPFNADFFSYPDKYGTPKMFDAEQIQALYRALRDYTALIRFFGAGQIGSLPTQPVVIP